MGCMCKACSWTMVSGEEEDLISAHTAKDKVPPSRAQGDVV